MNLNVGSIKLEKNANVRHGIFPSHHLLMNQQFVTCMETTVFTTKCEMLISLEIVQMGFAYQIAMIFDFELTQGDYNS